MIANLVFDAKKIEDALADKGIVVKTLEPIEAYGREFSVLEAHANPEHEFWKKAFPGGMKEDGTKVFHIISDKPGFFWGDFNFDSRIEYSDYEVIGRFPSFNLKTGQYFTDDQISKMYSDKIRFCDWPEDMWGLVQSYGVADNVEQVLERFKAVVDHSEIEIVLSFTPILKKEQPEYGGWRWHKWGEYIGTHEIQHEYLYDEEGIEEVLVFQVYPVKKKGDNA